MPFDLHIIPAEESPQDDAGELLLPDELAELAAQLGDDAQHLSVCYPAKLPSSLIASGYSPAEIAGIPNTQNNQDEKVGHVRYSSGRLLQAMTAAAAVVGLVAAVSTLRWIPESADEPVERSIIAEVPNDRENTNPVNTVITPHRLPNDATSVPSLSPSPTFYLHEYSGPELEGIYDLLGESPDDKISI